MSISRNNEVLALVGGTLIDGTGAQPVPNSAVLIADGHIVAVGPMQVVSIPTSATVVDISSHYVVPGMIDMHVHLRSGPDDRLRLGGGDVPSHLDMTLPTIALKGFSRARRTLRMGFTTLRDVGDIGNLGVSLRDAIADGVVEGPRILASGPNLTTTGGSGDYIPDWLIRTDTETRVADGIEGLRKAVRRNIKHKTDWIKFFATGTFGDGGDQDFTDAEMQVITEEAHRRGKLVCAHACFTKGTLAAVKAGVDTIEHGSRLDDEVVEEMVKRGTVLVPTIYIFDAIVRQGRAAGMKANAVAVAEATLESHVASFQKALSAGIPIAMGSDCGNAPTEHGTNAIELELMVRYGMTPMEALVSATSGAARALRLQDKIGTIAAGKSADIVVVKDDPLADIRVLQQAHQILTVIKDGAICSGQSSM